MKQVRKVINDMGSRLIINGISDNLFEPNRDITRAEFETIIKLFLDMMITHLDLTNIY